MNPSPDDCEGREHHNYPAKQEHDESQNEGRIRWWIGGKYGEEYDNRDKGFRHEILQDQSRPSYVFWFQLISSSA